ncbi:MAG: ABC transporter substrate-binding protein [Lachnospiraceae bacterium]|nr:ABC transporter substrate-binding protein [Lachnospiraceae bacterium]
MKRTTKKILMIISLITMVFGAMACGKNDVETASGGATSTQKEEQLGEGINQATSLKIGDQDNYLTAKVALEKGFFEDEFGKDFDVEVSSFTGGPALTEALLANQIDLAMYADLPAVQAKANNVDIKIISTFWQADDAYSLIAGKESGIETLKDLKGKRLAIRTGTQGHKLILNYLKSVGLTGDDVELVGLEYAESLSALSTGDIDGFIGFTVDNDKNVEQTGGHVVSTSEGYDNTVVYQIANNEYASKNPDIIARYLKVLDKTNQWIAENKEEASQITADFIGTTPDVIEQYWDSRTFKIGWEDSLYHDISNTIDFAVEQGTIESKFDAEELVDLTYLEKAGLYE